MMMNFIDLSTASEEERRLIREILSDTSVVNFAEPLNQQYPTQLEQQQNQQQQQQQNCNNQQNNRLHYNQHQQHNKQTPQQNQQHHNHHQQHQHQHSQPNKVKLHQQQQQNYVAASKAHQNHIRNNNLDREQDNQYLQSQVTSQAQITGSTTTKLSDNGPSSSIYNSHLSAHNTTITSTTNTSNSIDSNNVNINLTNSKNINAYHTNDNSANNGNIKSFNYPINPQDDISQTSSLAKTTTTIHTSLANNATYTTSNVTQSTSTVPPQTIANQMPPLMAGDMNSVIGMDMASSQAPSYPVPTPQPTHVTAYGPAPPPPPHHVYGGPPIFQPYAAHYIFPYNLPYAMPYVLPPTNSVVPTRQQVAPQSNQQSNMMMSNNTQLRPHAHHNRSNKLKEMPKQQYQHHNHNHHQQHSHQMHHSVQHQQGYRPNVGLNTNAPAQINEISAMQVNAYDNYSPKVNQQNDIQQVSEGVVSEPGATSVPETQEVQSQRAQNHQTIEPVEDTTETVDKVKTTNDEENIKVSSDEGFDTQSSLDLSKHSHESNNTQSAADRLKSKKETPNDPAYIKPEKVPAEPNNDDKSQLSQEAKTNTGPWGSASSKSWASLFRPDGTSYNGPSINGDIEHDPSASHTEKSHVDSKSSVKIVERREANGKSPNNQPASTKQQRSQDAVKRAQDKLAPGLAKRINSITLKHSIPVLRPRGFINKGNGCYINSTLQALIACPPFYNLMKEIGEFKGFERDNSCTPILDSFAELFQNFPPTETVNKKTKQTVPTEQKLPMNSLQADAIEPKCIYNVLGQIKSECLRGAQEDAEEFLSSVLNGLHEEMISLSETLQSSHNNASHQGGKHSDTEENNDDINNDENLWREVGPKNRSLPIRTATVINTPIQEIFGGSLFSIRTAGKDRCGHRSPFFDLQLDISGDNVKSLHDAIKSFTATEIIQDFYCSKTKQKLDAQRRTSLDQLPPILILHLKQFIYTQDHGLKKLMKRIEYPVDFELPESCLHDKNSDRGLRLSRSYKLLAVVYHEGKEAVKGHYLTDVYHIGSNQWIRCDDSNLKVVAAPRIENQESSRTPYLLFYRRLNTLGPRLSSNHDNKKKN